MPLRLVTKSKENTLRPYHSPPLEDHEDGLRDEEEIRDKLGGTYVRITTKPSMYKADGVQGYKRISLNKIFGGPYQEGSGESQLLQVRKPMATVQILRLNL